MGLRISRGGLGQGQRMGLLSTYFSEHFQIFLFGCCSIEMFPRVCIPLNLFKSSYTSSALFFPVESFKQFKAKSFIFYEAITLKTEIFLPKAKKLVKGTCLILESLFL